jgi:putative phosphoserine phosphatase/1-acylglycerol-3-phosphate O-acyltransferase
MTGGAFFDLDRTLLPHASGTIYAKYLEAEGLNSGAARIPGAELLVSLYDLFGETRLNMQVAQQAVKTAKGWSVVAVERAAERAVDDLVSGIPGYAKLLLEEHREAGVKLVIATTSPTVLVAPLAERLGFDGVIGTEWSHDGTHYDGTTVGEFIWGTKKRDAVVSWATEHDLSLADCFAYSDSYYDGSMLDAVGHPVAVNPDARLAAVAALQGWEIRNFDAPPGVMKLVGLEMQDWIRPFSRSEFLPLAEWEFSGLDNIPEDGPTILAFNHRSYFDTMAMNLLIARTGRPCRFLAKRELFENPLLGPIAKLAGGIRVDRGTGSNEPLRRAVDALKAGEMVAIAPQGTIPRGPAFFEPVLVGRPGTAQLAKDTKAPVIPVGLWGTEKVWPRNQKLPSLDFRSRPTVSVTVGQPVDIKRRSVDADTKLIMAAISALLPDEANIARAPTDEELALTYPAGHKK